MARHLIRHRHAPDEIQDSDAEGFRPLVFDDGEMRELEPGEPLDCQLTTDAAFLAETLADLIEWLAAEGADVPHLFARLERLRTIAE